MKCKQDWGDKLTGITIKWTGSTNGILSATGLMCIWLIYAYFAKFSEDSQLVLSSVTGVITFVMLFLIQKGQNKADKATQIKLDKIIIALDAIDNSAVSIEDSTEAEIDQMKLKINEDK